MELVNAQIALVTEHPTRTSILGRPATSDATRKGDANDRLAGSGSQTPVPVDLWETLLSKHFVIHAIAHPRSPITGW